MAADETSRKIFARNCRKLIEDHDFDGIDLDWEYPGYAAHSGTPADKENFNLLLEDIRKELDDLEGETGKFYGLTAALPCGPSNINNIDISTISQYLTEFNLMSYGMLDITVVFICNILCLNSTTQCFFSISLFILDFHGAWDSTTGVNSPLYDQSSDPEPGW
ncbi:hypothetical protein ACHAXR_000379, partial [Thalassiosira sp. AJA248-18]